MAIYNNEYIKELLVKHKLNDQAKQFEDEKLESFVFSEENNEVIQKVFTELRMIFARVFKLEQICFLFGNGCSIYAGSKDTKDLNLRKFTNNQIPDEIAEFISNIENKSMEEQFNSLIAAQSYFQVQSPKNEEIISDLIGELKKELLTEYVNSLNYNALNFHDQFFRKLRSYNYLEKLNLFTTNYDLALEYTMDKLGIDYSDGFTGFINRKFNALSLSQTCKPKLVKIHGSTNWFWDASSGYIKEVQPQFKNGNFTLPKTQSKLDNVIIYPSRQKLYQTYNSPYSELMRYMLDCFSRKSNVIIVIGYKYGDEHINEILYKSIANPHNVFFFLDFDNVDNCDFMNKMKVLSNELENINILQGHILGNFEYFVKYLLPAKEEKNDEEKLVELLRKITDNKE